MGAHPTCLALPWCSSHSPPGAGDMGAACRGRGGSVQGGGQRAALGDLGRRRVGRSGASWTLKEANNSEGQTG